MATGYPPIRFSFFGAPNPLGGGGVVPPIPLSRFYTDLLSSMQSHGVFTDQLVIPANTDFDLEFKTSLTDGSTSRRPLGSNASTPANEIRLDVPNNRVRFIADGTFSNFDGTYTVLNFRSLLTYRFVRTGSTVELFINGMSFGTATNSSALSIDFLGRQTALYYAGVIANLLLWTGGDRTTGTQILDCPLDEGSELPYFANRAATLGSELADDYLDLANWTTVGVIEEISGDEVKLTAQDGSSDRGEFAVSGLTIGSTYLISVDARAGAGSSQAFQLWTFGNIPVTSITEDRTYEFAVEATATSGVLRAYAAISGTSGDEVFIGGISIREIPAATPYITKENINDSQTVSFDQSLSTARGGYYQATDGERLNLAAYEAGRTDRNITRFLVSMQSSGTFTDFITLSGDFKLRITQATTLTSDTVLIGRSDGVGDILFTGNNLLRLRINGGSFFSFGTPPSGINLSDGEIHVIEVTRVGSSITATVDGLAFPTALSDSDPFVVNTLASRQNALYWNGPLLDLQIEDAGTLIMDCPLDEPASTPYFANRAATLGSELVTDNTSGTWVNSRAGSITNVANGIRATASSTGTQGAVYPLTGLTVGRSYAVSFSTSSDDTTGDVFPRAATDQGLTANNQDLTGSYPVEETTNVTGIFTAITTTMYVGAVRTSPGIGTYLEMTGMTIREIPATTPYITKENINDAQTKAFTYNQAVDWLNAFWPNLLRYSEQLTNSVWREIDGATVTENFEGDADRIQFAGGSVNEQVEQTTVDIEGGTANKTFTVSAVMKANSGSPVVRLKNTHGGVIDNLSSNITLTNEFVRYEYTVTNDGSTGSGRQIPGIHVGSFLNSADIIVQNMQLEESPSFTTYKQTTDTVGRRLQEA